MLKKVIIPILILTLSIVAMYAQSIGDFKSRQTGYWSITSTWSRYNGVSWVNATSGQIPTSTSKVTIVPGCDVTVSSAGAVAGSIIIDDNGSVGGNLTINNGASLTVSGDITNTTAIPSTTHFDIITVNGTLIANNITLNYSVNASKYQKIKFCVGTASSTSAQVTVNNKLTLNGNSSVYVDLYLFGKLTLKGSDPIGATPPITINNVGNTSEVIFDSNSAQTIKAFASNEDYRNLTIKGSGQRTLGSNITVRNTLTMTAGSLSLNSYSLYYNSSASLLYNGSAAQTVTGEWPASANMNVTISNTSTDGVTLNGNKSILSTTVTVTGRLNCNTYVIYGSGAFTLASGGTIATANTAGLNGSITLTGTKNFSTGANYIFNGTNAQVTGSLMPATVNNLEINNSAGVTLSQSVTVTSNLKLTNGAFVLSSNTLTLNGAIVKTSGTLTGGNDSEIVVAGTVSTLSLPSVTLKNLTVNRPNGVTLAGNTSIINSLTVSSGCSFNIGSYILTLNGDLFLSGTLTGGNSSEIIVGGTGSALSLPALTLKNLTVNRPNGVTLAGNLAIANNLTVSSGCILNKGAYTISGNVINGGTIKSAIANIGTTVTHNAGSTIEYTASGIAIPADAGYKNLKLSADNGSFTLGGDITIANTFDIGNNTVSIGSYVFTINGTVIGSGTIIGGSSAGVAVGSTSPGILPSQVNILTVSSNVGPVTLPNDVEVAILTIENNAGLALNKKNLTFSEHGITFSGETIITSISVSNEIVPNNMPRYINREWTITGSAEHDIITTFSWSAADDNYFNWGSRVPAVFSATNQYTGVYNVESDPRTITVTLPASFSKGVYKIGPSDNPLPVYLSSFTAEFVNNFSGNMYVSIKWTTQSETNLHGYYIYRGTTNVLDTAEQIPSLIPPANSSDGASYEFIDREIQSGTTYYYWLQSLDMDGSSDFYGPERVFVNGGDNNHTPVFVKETKLLNAYPNPFYPNTTLCYTLKERGQVTIEIYNVKGQLIRSFMPPAQDKGYYQIFWDGKDMKGTQASSGVYYARMTCGKYISSQRLVLMK